MRQNSAADIKTYQKKKNTVVFKYIILFSSIPLIVSTNNREKWRKDVIDIFTSQWGYGKYAEQVPDVISSIDLVTW